MAFVPEFATPLRYYMVQKVYEDLSLVLHHIQCINFAACLESLTALFMSSDIWIWSVKVIGAFATHQAVMFHSQLAVSAPVVLFDVTRLGFCILSVWSYRWG
jgi:hypothetical protein